MVVGSSGEPVPRITSTSTIKRHTLLSFERPAPGPATAPGGHRARAHLENSIVAKRVLFDQENKSTRWMPWRQEPMKDVGGCDKRGGGADQPLIPRSPNGKTYAW